MSRNPLHNSSIPFPISLSVGTACQAKCPYCSIPTLPQQLANGYQLIEATRRLISEMECYFRSFTVRITGGEIGLVTSILDYLNWLSEQENIVKVRIYTNGLLFDLLNEPLEHSFFVDDHTIHDISSDGKLLRYARDGVQLTLNALSELIHHRRSLCLNYRMVMVERPDLSADTRRMLERAGIHFLTLTGYSESIDRPSGKEQTTFCFDSRYLYVYDVAHDLYFHCCEVKNPARGKRFSSLAEFFSDERASGYPECQRCKTYADIQEHRNSAAITEARRLWEDA